MDYKRAGIFLMYPLPSSISFTLVDSDFYFELDGIIVYNHWWTTSG